jgi:hypothetical protein
MQCEPERELLGYWAQYGGREASSGVGTRVSSLHGGGHQAKYSTIKGHVYYILNIIFIWRRAYKPVLRIRIRRIHMFLGFPVPHPDTLIRDMDPDPSIIKQKYLEKH